MNWEKLLDELYEVRIKQKSGNRPLGQEAVREFIRAEIIKEIIQDASNILSNTAFLTPLELRQKLKDKWL